MGLLLLPNEIWDGFFTVDFFFFSVLLLLLLVFEEEDEEEAGEEQDAERPSAANLGFGLAFLGNVDVEEADDVEDNLFDVGSLTRIPFFSEVEVAFSSISMEV